MSIELAKPPELSQEERLVAAESLAEERMTMLFDDAMTAWHRSQGEKTVKRHSDRTGETITTTRECCGEPRYLQQALRITQAQVKLAVRDRRTQEALLAAQLAPEALLGKPAVAPQPQPKPEKPKFFTTPFVPLPEDIVVPGGVVVIDLDDIPPVMGCSASSAMPVRAELGSSAALSASRDSERLSDKQREQRSAFLGGETARKGTVQSAEKRS